MKCRRWCFRTAWFFPTNFKKLNGFYCSPLILIQKVRWYITLQRLLTEVGDETVWSEKESDRYCGPSTQCEPATQQKRGQKWSEQLIWQTDTRRVKTCTKNTTCEWDSGVHWTESMEANESEETTSRSSKAAIVLYTMTSVEWQGHI